MRNIRLRRDSVISPSISSFSSLTAMAASVSSNEGTSSAPVATLSDHGLPMLELRDHGDVCRLRALLTLAGLERDLRPLGERLEPVTEDRAVMDEQVLRPFGRGDE